jgi:hypothetical protein
MFHGLRVEVPGYNSWYRFYDRQDFRNFYLARLPLSDLPFFRDDSHKFNLSPNQAVRLIQHQRREAFRRQDYIFATLGLFPNEVRSTMPTNMDISFAAATAMLLFARVATGDIMALVHDEEPEQGEEHCITTTPWWLPRRYGQALYKSTPGGAWDFHADFPGEVLPALCAQNNSLWMKVPYYRIQNATIATSKDVKKSVKQLSKHDASTSKERGKHRDVNLDDPAYPSAKAVEIGVGNIIISIQVLPLLTVNLYFPRRNTPAESRAWDRLQEAVASGFAVLACIRASKHTLHWLVLGARSAHHMKWEVLGSLETGIIRDGFSNCGDNAPPAFEFVLE